MQSKNFLAQFCSAMCFFEVVMKFLATVMTCVAKLAFFQASFQRKKGWKISGLQLAGGVGERFPPVSPLRGTQRGHAQVPRCVDEFDVVM